MMTNIRLAVLFMGLLPIQISSLNNNVEDGLVWPGKSWNVPSTLPSMEPGLISPVCKRHFNLFLKELNEMEIWALKMYDASGKFASGLLRGNSAQLGDYEECLSISAPKHDIEGKYCLTAVYVDLRDSSQTKYRDILDLIQSHRVIQSTPNDVHNKIAPSFSELIWGTCVPSSCSVNEVQSVFSHFLMKYNTSETGLDIKVVMKDTSCKVLDKSPFLTSTKIIVMLIYAVLISATVFATITDSKNIKLGEKNMVQSFPESRGKQIVMSFSLYKTVPELINTKFGEDDITCIHGIRFIFSMAIFLMHRAIFGLFVPYTNRTLVAELLESSWTMIFRAFWNTVDSFVLISGLLTSYFNVKKLVEGKKLNIWSMYIQRYVKFTPVFFMTILMLNCFDKELSNGPLSLHVTDHFVEKCANMWKSVLYISNIDGINDMCYPPSHQLITDMQMYIMSPFILMAMWKWKRFNTYGIALVVAILTAWKGAFIYNGNFASVIYYGAPVKMITDVGDQLYLNPLHRMTPYLFGMLLGYILQIRKSKSYGFSSESLNLGWSIAIVCGYYSFFGLSGASKKGYQPNALHSAIFAMAQPVLWSFALSWVIFICHTGQSDLVNKILSWKGFLIFSRISYPFYMVQILIIFWWISSTKIPQRVSFATVIDLNEISLILGVTVVFTLLFLLPLKGIIAAVKGQKSSKSIYEKVTNEKPFETYDYDSYSEKHKKIELLELDKKKAEAVDFSTLLNNLSMFEESAAKNETVKF